MAVGVRGGLGRLARAKGGLVGMVVAACLVAGCAGVAAWAVSGPGYQATIVFPEATDLVNNTPVYVRGFKVGQVTKLGVNNGQAMVTVSVGATNAPLHSGTKAAIDYKAILGERYVEITPGPRSNPPIPSGGVVPGGAPRVELAQVMSTLDPATRAHLVSLIPELGNLLSGPNAANAQQTLRQAAPTVKALSQVLAAVGQDGFTLHQLVANMAKVSSRLVKRQGDVVGTIQGLDQALGAIAQHDRALRSDIRDLPPTLVQARSTLSRVPATTKQVLPLLADLQPGARALPAFAADLRPVVSDLSPITSQLGPTLSGLESLLHYTPPLVGVANATVPGVDRALGELQPASAFLRPYTPELVGFMGGWGAWLASYNGAGHYGPFIPMYGPAANDAQATRTGFLPGGGTVNDTPAPGSLVGQPWTDAAGNGVR